VNKLKHFLQENHSDTDTELQDLNFNNFSNDKPITRARAILINYNNAANLALLMLNDEGRVFSEFVRHTVTLYTMDHAPHVNLRMTILN
jgi:hypothetical protein